MSSDGVVEMEIPNHTESTYSSLYTCKTWKHPNACACKVPEDAIAGAAWVNLALVELTTYHIEVVAKTSWKARVFAWAWRHNHNKTWPWQHAKRFDLRWWTKQKFHLWYALLPGPKAAFLGCPHCQFKEGWHPKRSLMFWAKDLAINWGRRLDKK